MLSLEQYHAARRGAVFLDRSARGKVGLQGGDRLPFLHALLTNDIASLERGTGCYAAYLTPQGRMICDMRVLAIDDRALLDVHPSVTDALVQRLDQLVFSEDVTVEDLTGSLALLGVHGPTSHAAVAAVLGMAELKLRATVASGFSRTLERYAPYQNATFGLANGSLTIVRDDQLGEQGFEVYAPLESATALAEALRESGATEIDADTAEVLRVEAGRPAFRTDMGEDTIPLEAGIEDRAISLTKGCYVGQEVIVRVLHRGHGRVARKLVGFSLNVGAGLQARPSQVPARGDVIYRDEKPIGRVTSAVFSPSLDRPIGLGYVQRHFTAPGVRIAIGHGDERLDAEVVSPPFVTPSSASR